MTQGFIENDDAEITVDDIDPSSFTIHVQNGAGIDGAGAFVSGILSQNGFNVINTDNANTTAYPDTLIIYDADNMKDNAQAIKTTINNGRLVQSSGRYTMDSDILVIIGADLKI